MRIAGGLHDLGRVAVPNLIWDKPGPLNAAEWEQVRLHAHQTERFLARSPLLAPVAALAGAIHERGDGSGYPKGLRAAHLDEGTRLLAASEVYRALREDRPHRPAFGADKAAQVLTVGVCLLLASRYLHLPTEWWRRSWRSRSVGESSTT